ncbi:MAG: VWA containing CoxE family protein [Candidatus Freyarchaeum deiterrae]
MLIDFFFLLKQNKIPVTITEWLTYMEALSKGLHNCRFNDFYFLTRALLVKNECYFDAFDQCFAQYFRDVEGSLTIDEEFLKWLENPRNQKYLSPEELEFLKHLNVEELRRLLEERLKEQKERHDGGDKWIGTGGTSPFGVRGAHPTGISFGDRRGSGTAMKYALERRYQNYRHDLTLDIRQIQMALKKLRLFKRVGVPDELCLEDTIDETCKNAGELELIFHPERKNRVKVLLLMDTGGSMDPYSDLVNQLFSAAHSLKFFKDFQYFYFHNCVYQYVYKDMAQLNSTMVATADLMQKYDKNYKLIIVGDANMHPAELMEPGGAIYFYPVDTDETPGIVWLTRLRDHFKKAVWINPAGHSGWTINTISRIFPMFQLTINDLEEAVKALI